MKPALTERQAARRSRVIEAAIKLAAEGGYEAVQMRDVAAEADVALGTLYRYFSSKDHLLVAALGEWAGELRSRLATRPAKGDTPADRVVDTLRRAARALEREPTLTGAFVTGLTALSFDDRGIAQAMEVYAVMSQIITDSVDGSDDPELDDVIQVLGRVWLATLIAWVRGWAPPGQMAKDLETAARLLLRS